MKSLRRNQRAVSGRCNKAKNYPEFEVDVTHFMKIGTKKVFDILTEGKGTLEIHKESVSLVFWNLSDREKFLQERENACA